MKSEFNLKRAIIAYVVTYLGTLAFVRGLEWCINKRMESTVNQMVARWDKMEANGTLTRIE